MMTILRHLRCDWANGPVQGSAVIPRPEHSRPVIGLRPEGAEIGPNDGFTVTNEGVVLSQSERLLD